jgi:hypothetical protein
LSKTKSKPASEAKRPFFCVAVLSAVLVLAGCGNVSLNQLLENQEPGELGISPKAGSFPAASTIEITGKGGFRPYTYERIGKGDIDPATGEYTAPVSGDISGNAESVEIKVTDDFGQRASATFTVYRPLSLSLSEDVIPEGATVTLDTSGGVPDYDIWIDGILAIADHPSGDWTSPVFTTAGAYEVEVVDDLGNSAQGALTVYAVGGDLMIDLAENWVLTGDSVTVMAINPSGVHTFSATAGSFDDVNAVTTDYNAPGSAMEVTITVVDSLSREATAVLKVLDSVPDPLTFPSTMTLEPSEKTSWLVATGGVPPYTFRLEGSGILDPLLADRLKYRAPGFEATEYLWVEDAVGQTRKLTITVEDD